MEKKNAMLLTVVAVATLLVAVVGATFAYFSVTATADNQTVAITGQTAAVGAPTLTTTTTAMHINLAAGDMAESAAGASYYTATGSDAYNTSATPYEIANMAVTGGDADASYTCNYTLTIKRSSSDTMIAKMVTGDGKLVLAGDTITGTKEHDLTTITTTGITVAGTVSNLSTTTGATVTAYAQINNTSSVQGFANTGLDLQITATQFDCTINE